MYAHEKPALSVSIKPLRSITLEYLSVRLLSGLLDCIESETISYQLIIASKTRLAIASSTFPLRAPPPFVVSFRGYSSCRWRHSGDGARGSPSQRNNTLYPLNSIPYVWQASHRAPGQRCCEPNIKLASIQADPFFLIGTRLSSSPRSQPQRFRSSDVHQNVHEKAKHPRKRGEATGKIRSWLGQSPRTDLGHGDVQASVLTLIKETDVPDPNSLHGPSTRVFRHSRPQSRKTSGQIFIACNGRIEILGSPSWGKTILTDTGQDVQVWERTSGTRADSP